MRQGGGVYFLLKRWIIQEPSFRTTNLSSFRFWLLQVCHTKILLENNLYFIWKKYTQIAMIPKLFELQPMVMGTVLADGLNGSPDNPHSSCSISTSLCLLGLLFFFFVNWIFKDSSIVRNCTQYSLIVPIKRAHFHLKDEDIVATMLSRNRIN